MAAETDEEQIEAVKKWLEDNGTSLVLTLVIAFGGTFGYRAYQNSVQETGENASALYESLSQALTTNDGTPPTDAMRDTGSEMASQLKADYEGSVYAVFAGLHMAKIAVADDDLGAAEAELRWALAHVDDDSLEAVTRIRLATVLASQEKFSEALVVLDRSGDRYGHTATWEETRGDILVAMGRDDEAREAYQLAINSVEAGVVRPFLQMKLDNLTFAEPTTAAADVTQVEE